MKVERIQTLFPRLKSALPQQITVQSHLVNVPRSQSQSIANLFGLCLCFRVIKVGQWLGQQGGMAQEEPAQRG